MGYFDANSIKELFASEGFIVGDIDLDEEGYVANIYIEVNHIGVYLPGEITSIVERIKKMETLLIEQGFIRDIKFGDLYNGTWRIIVHFLDEDEIEE